MTVAARRWFGIVARAARAAGQSPHSPAATLQVHATLDDGVVESITVHPDGVVAVNGWARNLDTWQRALTLTVDGRVLPPTYAYRVRRPDLAPLFGSTGTFLGAVAEWATSGHDRAHVAVLSAGERSLKSLTLPPLVEPAYAHLRTEERVLGREHIYGHGPPVTYVSSDVLELARTLPPPILDFGCGAGALVRALRGAGIETYGLELDDTRISGHLLDDARPWVTLYDGRLPSPFRTGQFRSICCSEVLEHIPDPQSVVREFARLAAEHLLITVPDISAIPRGFHHAVVPWHLLEATHVNFFTQRSLQALLAPLGSRVEFARIGRIDCDRLSYYTSLVALVQR